MIFHPASGIDETVAANAQADLRRRILRAFVGRGLLESFETREMLAYQHSGFSIDAGVCIAAHDRAALERLLRYCARPPFAMERLRKQGSDLVYRCIKQHSEPAGDKRGGKVKVDELVLTPPLWDECDAQMGDEMPSELDWDMAAQPAPDHEVDQRVNW